MSRSHHQTEQRSNKRAKNSRYQDRITKWTKEQSNIKIATTKSSRNYLYSPELPVSSSQPLNGPKVQISKKIATINERRKHFHHFCIGTTLKPAYRLSVSVCNHFTGWETSPSHHFLPRKWSSLLA